MATKKIEHFRTPVSEPVHKKTNSGEKLEEVLAMKLDEKGNEEFYVSGLHDTYAEIQAYADEVNLERIIDRCLETGDLNILNQVKKEYIDITEMPKNLIDAKNKINAAETEFYNLPLEIREKYDNNFNKYLADVGSEEWIQNMNFNNKEPDLEPLEEEKEGGKEE